MVGNTRIKARKSNACLAVLALALLAPLAGAIGGSLGATAVSNATLEAFADGAVSKTVDFAAGADADSSVFLRLPGNATVAEAAIDASVTADSAVSGGALVFDIGADGTADATASLSVLGTSRVLLPAEAFNAYLAARGAASGSVDIPITLTGAAAASWSVVLDGLAVRYSIEGVVDAAPTFTGEVGALAVASGSVNGSAVDLAAHFSGGAGENLTFSAQVEGGAEASGVSVVINGSSADVVSLNADWWGDVLVRFAAADAKGQVAFSNNVTVHVTPSPAEAPTVRTDVRAQVETVLIASCGAPALITSVRVPADAVVTEARMALETSAGIEALGATVEVLAGLEAAAGLELSALPSTLELNASALNAQIRAEASEWGLVDLELAVDVCPSGAAVELRASNLSVTYARGGAQAGLDAQVITGIAVNGEVAATVESDSALRFELETNGSLDAGTHVEWTVDGAVVGTGAAVEGVSLCRGNHTVEARASSAVGVRLYRTTLQAEASSAAEAVILINGAAAATVESGTALIVELRTREPMPAGAAVDWYVDGAFAGRGQVLANLTLSEGPHSIEARAQGEGAVHTYAAQVTASPATGAGDLTAVLTVSAALAAAAVAAVALRRRRH